MIIWKISCLLVRFGESICVDERELLPADGIWDVAAKQLEYFKKSAKCPFHDECPDEIRYSDISSD